MNSIDNKGFPKMNNNAIEKKNNPYDPYDDYIEALLDPESLLFDIAYKKALKTFAKKRPKLEDFEDISSYDNNLQEDSQLVQELRERFDAQKGTFKEERFKDVGLIIEAFIVDCIDTYSVINDNIHAAPGSMWDDFVTKADVNLEIGSKDEPLVIAADITLSERSLIGKLKRTEEEIKSLPPDDLPELRYYKSKKGTRAPVDIVKVVMYVPIHEVGDSIFYWADENHQEVSESNEGQYLSWQIIAQLEYFKNKSQEFGKNMAVEAYEHRQKEVLNEIFGDSLQKQFHLERIQQDLISKASFRSLGKYLIKMTDKLRDIEELPGH